MRILLVASAFNSLTQRIFAELRDREHDVHALTVSRGGHAALRDEVARRVPELIIAPMLTTAIPEDVWALHRCLVVHPGPPGDRGPSALDWALGEGVRRWGVTVLEAVAELDAGDVWAHATFEVPPVPKSDLYRNELADAATSAVLLAVERVASGDYRPVPQRELAEEIVSRPRMRQESRRVDWSSDSTDTVLTKLRAADSRPGVRDTLLGQEWFLHGGHPEERLRGAPGELLATRSGALCRATADGAVWLTGLRRAASPGRPAGFPLPATQALGHLLPRLPERPAPLRPPPTWRTFSDIWYEERESVGFVRFSFPGGAMRTSQCRRLLAVYRYARSRPVSVIVLGGVRDLFSHGIHLNVIEAADDPAAESWENLNALNDLVEAVLRTTDQLVVSALGGGAAAGGVSLALAADEVWCRRGVVLNPHYRLMGLYGSEYWTYVLPRRVGEETTEALRHEALPVSAWQADRLGMVDRVLDCSPADFAGQVAAQAGDLAQDPALQARLAEKKLRRERDEERKPLQRYREEEGERMRAQFFDPHSPYHGLRAAFVRKRPLERAGDRTR
ncbi:enoyl-CoA hydratase-related protein [Streptomyces sp. NPDC005438]|uniref:enoyl-CoA hydratase-related protein n=1 Tax=Streptomyces sp. NPDC005438 TaxID=3156880 RepID=UPI0033BDBF39